MKNPFEVRSDILELAKEYMDKQVELNTAYAEKMQAMGKIKSEEYMKAFQPYSFEELMDKAQEMYSFVCSKGDNK